MDRGTAGVGVSMESRLYKGKMPVFGLDQNKVVLRLYVLTYLVQRYMRGCVSDKQLRSLSDFEGWRHFVDNDISWTLFFKMGDFSWTFSKGDVSWTLLVTSRGQF